MTNQFPRKCNSCGRLFGNEASFMAHINKGHFLRTCEACGGKCVRIIRGVASGPDANVFLISALLATRKSVQARR